MLAVAGLVLTSSPAWAGQRQSCVTECLEAGCAQVPQRDVYAVPAGQGTHRLQVDGVTGDIHRRCRAVVGVQEEAGDRTGDGLGADGTVAGGDRGDVPPLR